MATNRHWLQLPHAKAPSPEDRKKIVTYAISEDLVQRLFAANRLTMIFQLWAHVVGELPPIHNVSRLLHGEVTPSLTTLAQSVACFRGVNRPYDDEEEGESVLVYVLNPTVSVDRDVNLVCLAKAVKVPSGTCLTVQVKPTKPLQSDESSVEKGVTRSFDSEDVKIIRGVVTRLEFVSGNGEIPILPKRHAGRYRQKLWQTE